MCCWVCGICVVYSSVPLWVLQCVIIGVSIMYVWCLAVLGDIPAVMWYSCTHVYIAVLNISAMLCGTCVHTRCCVGRHSSCYVVQLYTCVHYCVEHFSYVVWYMCTHTLLCWTTFQLCYVVQQYIAALENVLIVSCESHVANECCPILFSSKECSSTKKHTRKASFQ